MDRSDEDKIIESIVIEGNSRLYDDTDFLPIRQSLYNIQTIVPDYDDDIALRVTWCRPNKISESPEYFRPSPAFNSISCKQKSLPDEVFLGTLMAVAVYPGQDLIENIFASRSEDFLVYGVYTCRFYVEGEWVDVVTDTTIPCLRNEDSGLCSPVYGQSGNLDEMWVSLAEKAYAKAVGSYEAIQKVRVHEGGSVQHFSFREESNKELTLAGGTFKLLNRHLKNDTMVLLIPADKSADKEAGGAGGQALDEDGNPDDVIDASKAEDAFLAGRLYSVVACRDIGGFELMLLHNPWQAQPQCWRGSWSDESPDWDLYPEICSELEEDESIPWTRSRPNGYFWMTGKMVNRFFSTAYLCKLFPNDKFSFYCMRGEWRGRQAGGPVATIRDRPTVVKDAAASRQTAAVRATAAVVVDGDSSWFNNPQYRVTSARPTVLYISVLPVSGQEGDAAHVVTVTVTSSIQGPSTVHPHLWDAALSELAAEGSSTGRVKGQECAVWALNIDPRKTYHVVPHTLRRSLEGPFLVRLFSTDPVTVESVPSLTSVAFDGSWIRNSELDTAGGPVMVPGGGVDNALVENSKWCQNPQFHLEVVDPYSKDEIFMKVVVRRVDKEKGGTTKAAAGAEAKADVTVGLVICRAECLEDTSAARKKAQPRQNALGELMPTKASSLRKRREEKEEVAQATRSDSGKTVLRKTSVMSDVNAIKSTFTSKTEACLYFPKIPRAWMPNGLIIVPCLSEKGVRGKFELEVYSSETMNVNQLHDAYARSVAGEWAEGLAGGSHLNPLWKKNPRFSLNIRNTSRGSASRIRITISRSGSNWRALCKRDTVGCMIGFYIFVNNLKTGEQQQIFESTFVPAEELSTDPSFTLDQLSSTDSEYILMPTTHGEGKFGAFVLSIICEHEFSLKKEK